MMLEPDQIAQEIDDYRRARLRQGIAPEQVAREIARKFGADLDALGMDEVGTPDAFGLEPAPAPDPDLFS